MTTYHGTTVKLVIERLSAEGKIAKEYLGALDGGEGDQDFYTKNFPITDNAGATSDDETEVDVYTDDGGEGSWSEYSDDGSDFEIDGSEGLVTIKAAENQAGNADEHICISYYTTAEVGMGQSASIDFEGSLEETYKLGDRDPQDLKAGLKTISGTIAQLYASRDLIGKFLGESDFYEKLTDFTVYLYPNGETAGQPQIKLTNVKFSGGSISVSVDSIMAANVSFKGLAIEIGTVPA